MTRLVVNGRRVALDDGIRPASVRIEGGRIVSIDDAHDDGPDGGRVDTTVAASVNGVSVIDAGDLVVLPGLVDSHVHVNEPGRTEWEGFAAATRAAAAGGTTTIVDMPLNSIPPTVTVAALDTKREAARGRCLVDVAFWGGLVPGHLDDLEPLAAAGVCGFKAFMVDSGVDEFPPAGAALLREALDRLATLDRPLLVHAELEAPMADAARRFAARSPADRRRYASYLASRPHESEDEAVRLVAELARATGAHVHVVHLASGPAVGIVEDARADGVVLTAETCPHYLTLSADDVPDGATAFKCCPPIREVEHRKALWEGLASGGIEMIVSDHSPAPPELKAIGTGDFGDCWGGISSLQLRLPLVWSEARGRGFGLERLAEWLATAPARLAGIDDRKGRIAVGLDGDLVVFDPDGTWTVDPARLEHRHAVSPYAGRTLSGRVVQTILRGRVVFGPDGIPASAPTGALLGRRR
jgi:allantoinase